MSASALSPLCSQVLNLPAEQRSPVSPYVKRVIDRAEEAMTYIDSETLEDIPFDVPHWAYSVFSTAVTLIDTTQRLTMHTLSLEEHSACLAFDSFLVECEMEKVLDSINSSFAQGHSLGVMKKQTLLLFLNERLKHLHAGAYDPSYIDPTWGNLTVFDPPAPVWCCPESIPGNTCEQTTEQLCLANGGSAFDEVSGCMSFGCDAPAVPPPPSEGQQCPYHSDYFPPSRGFGCDLTVVEPRTAYPPTAGEEQALRAISEQLVIARAQGAVLFQLEQEIADLTGNTPPPAPPAQPPHRQGFGCQQKQGYCQADRRERCSSDEDCEEGELGACIIQPGFCSVNANRWCAEDADCAAENLGTCIQNESPVPLRQALRGRFSIHEDILSLLRRFLDLRTKQGGSRTYIDDLKIPAEFRPDQTEERDQRGAENPFTQGMRTAARVLTRTWSRLQSAAEAVLFTRSIDPMLSVADNASSLRAPIATIARSASERGRLRKIVKGFAYYLRRSCMFRPCRAKLEHTMKIAETDACFPYANGRFLEDTVGNPRWLKCAQDACLILPGVTLDGAKCQCFRIQAPPNDPLEVDPGDVPPPDYCIPREG